MSSLNTFTGDMQQDIGIAKTDLAKNDKAAEDTENKSYAGYQDTVSKLADGYSKLQKEAADIKPFEAPKKQDPMTSFGSLMSGAMGIVSLATGKSMIASLNAGAAAINATKENNDQEYTKAYEAWKTNTDFAFKQLDWENKQISTLMDMAKDNHAEAGAHIKTLSAITGDKALSITYDAQGIEGVQKLLDARQKVQNDGIENAGKLEELHEKKMALGNYQDWIKQNPTASPEQKTDMLNKTLGRYSTSASSMAAEEKDQLFNNMKAAKEKELGRPLKPDEELKIYKDVNAKDSPITGNEREKLQSRVDLTNESLDTIDETVATLNSHILSAGVTGRARRLGEVVGNLLGDNQTDLVQMRRSIEYLQMMAPRLLTDANGRPMSAEASKVSDIIGGLSMGDTTANTLRSLQQVQSLLQQNRDQTLSQLQGSWAPSNDPSPGGSSAGGSGGKSNSTPPAKATATPWANDPVVGP